MKQEPGKKQAGIRSPLVSVIVRTKNEERWITFCLDMIFKQTHKNVEVIVVDNESDDHTVALAKKFPVKVINIKNFLPGKAINQGARASRGRYLVCLSAHCVPKNEFWLENLLKNFEHPAIAGVYGRQEPLASSPDNDKRDLIITFGLDRRVQQKDSFFHNANSMFRRDIWKKIPFDEQVANIEDRLWGKQVIDAGYRIVYEPEASVYHYHGIHQNGNVERANNIVRILQELNEHPSLKEHPEALHPEKLEIVALLPVRGMPIKIGRRDLLGRCVTFFKKSPLVKKVFVLSNVPQLKSAVVKMGGQFILRPKSLSGPDKSIEDILRFGSEQLARRGIMPDVVLYANYLFPFRPENIVENLVMDLVSRQLDSVIAGLPEYGSYWVEKDGGLERVDKGFMSRDKKSPIFQGLLGVGCATLPRFIREGRLLGDKVGIIPVGGRIHHVKIQDEFDDFNKKIAGFFLERERNLLK